MTLSISNELAMDLLFRMKRIRGVEETIATRYTEWKIRCPTHLCTGQEAVSAGVGVVLRKDDLVVSTHRSHGHYLAKGGDLKGMIAELYGKSTGCSSGRGGSMHLIDLNVGFMGSTSIVGGTIPVGTGLGFAISLNGTDQVSCVFLGDGSTEEGVFYESLNFAALKKLPVLYICENNLYSVYSSLSVRQPQGRNIHQMAAALGVSSDSGDGNDILAVFSKVDSAVKSIRSGEGPVFLEFSTYRWREHCGPNFDNDIGYRTEKEFLEWKDKDPIIAWETQLIAEGVTTGNEISAMEACIEHELTEAFAFAEESPFPLPSEAGNYIYKSLTPREY